MFDLFLKERNREWAGLGQRERHTQNPKQAPGSELWAQSLTPGSNSLTARSWPEQKLDLLNRLSQPGAPYSLFSTQQLQGFFLFCFLRSNHFAQNSAMASHQCCHTEYSQSPYDGRPDPIWPAPTNGLSRSYPTGFLAPSSPDHLFDNTSFSQWDLSWLPHQHCQCPCPAFLSCSAILFFSFFHSSLHFLLYQILSSHVYRLLSVLYPSPLPLPKGPDFCLFCGYVATY